jgi:type I pantothenate kinase
MDLIRFPRARWSALTGAPLHLTGTDLGGLASLNDPLDLAEVNEIYLPLARLLTVRAEAAAARAQATAQLLSTPELAQQPYLLGIAGSVAVGKSTTARLLQRLLSRWPHPRTVELVPTDGFLLPNHVLEARGLLQRKGFPESYDRPALLAFLSAVRAGATDVTVPVYSHLAYDVLPDQRRLLPQPQILIVEGLNILQTGGPGPHSWRFASDFFDDALYVHADPLDIERWYVERFLALRQAAFADPRSYFHGYAGLSDEEARAVALDKWRTINEPNLRENIAPTRERATLVLEKRGDHRVEAVSVRRF